MYKIYVIFKCFPDVREAFVKRVKEEGILDAIRAEDGCYRYDYYFSDSDPCEILLIEEWESKQHQQIHISQPHMDRLRAFNDDYIISATLGEFEIK